MRSKLSIYLALSRGVLLESVRRKDLWVVAILGGLIICAAGTLGFFGLQGLQVFVKDLAFNVLGLFSTTLAILTSTRQLPDELKNRTLYPLLSRPITRLDFLVGKALGATLASWLAFGILLLTTTIGLLIFKVSLEPIMLQYIFAKMLGLALVCILSQTLSIYMTASGAATLAFLICFGAGRVSQALVMAFPQSGPAAQWTFKILNVLIPQVGLFDLGSRAANIGWPLVPMWVIGALIVYLVVYGGGVFALSFAKFSKRAL